MKRIFDRPRGAWLTAVAVGLVCLSPEAAVAQVATGPARADSAPADSAPAEKAPAENVPTVTVTASRIPRPVGEVAAPITAFDREELSLGAEQTLDDTLRRVPGFGLFRRSSSLVAHPTSQGVTLRGVAPSGASRSLVLVDGIPANDPFGGWVYWSRIPSVSVESVEIVRGGVSSHWGNAALAGVVHVRTTAPGDVRVRATAEGGDRGTARAEAVVAERVGRLGVVADGRYFRTGGYPVVEDQDRGSIDIAADSESGTAGTKLVWQSSPSTSLRASGRVFRETRGNGTPLTGNDTESAQFAVGMTHDAAAGGTVEADLFATLQTFESFFSAQDADRNGERPALDQYDVPSRSAGASLVWTRPMTERWSVAAGSDALWVEGFTHERFFFGDTGFRREREAGGRSITSGAWIESVVAAGARTELSAAVRVDYWRTYDGRRREFELADGSVRTDRDFDARDRWLVSPRAGLVVRVTDDLRALGAAYRSFRAPTLNELYRPFRVRNDITEANEALDPERLSGFDVGLEWTPRPRWRVAVTGFWNEIEDTVANVTLAPGTGGVIAPCGFVPDGGSCRQRRNLDRTRARGVELEAAAPLLPALVDGLSVEGAALVVDSEIVRANDDPSIEGNELPQVADTEATLRLLYRRSRGPRAVVEARYVGRQFEDDRNRLPLDDAVTVGAAVFVPFARDWEVFVRAENLFDAEVEVGRTGDPATGLTTVGAPLRVSAGVSYQLR